MERGTKNGVNEWNLRKNVHMTALMGMGASVTPGDDDSKFQASVASPAMSGIDTL